MAVTGTIAPFSEVRGFGANKQTIHMHECRVVSGAGATVTECAWSVAPGALMALEVVPDAGGTKPDDLFDLTLNDKITEPLDILSGAGANLTHDAPTLLQFDPPILWRGGDLYPTLAAAGASKGITFRIYVAK